jgi:ATP phosphoribosyltransferase regulatory subunit
VLSLYYNKASWEGIFLNHKWITPEGTRDYLFEEAAARNQVAHKVQSVFQSRGFVEVQTPGVEFLDVFTGAGAGMPVEYMYKLVDAKGRLMAVRPDSTMPIARLCATRLQAESLPLRLYYRQSIFLAEPVMRGRSDQVLQMGVEYVGASGFAADLDILVTAIDTMGKLGVGRFEIGHIGIFNALMEGMQLNEAQREQVRSLIESKNYPALNDLLDRFGQNAYSDAMKQLPRLFGDEKVFAKARALFDDQVTVSELDYLEKLYQTLRKILPDADIKLDLGLVNRNDYYTGIVFRGYLEGIGREVLTGGRYDNLLESFGRTAPAVGFAVNVDAAAQYLCRHTQVEVKKPQLLIHGTEDFAVETFRLQREMIAQGVLCEVSAFETAGEALAYAKANHIPKILYVDAAGCREAAVCPAKEGNEA